MQYEITSNLLGAKLVKYACPNCNTSLKNPLKDAGKADACPQCRTRFRVPGESEKQQEEQAVQQREAAKQSEKEMKQRERIEAQRRTQATASKKPFPAGNSSFATPMGMPIQQPKTADSPMKTNGVTKNFVTRVLEFAIDITKSIIAVVLAIALVVDAIGIVICLSLAFYFGITSFFCEDATRAAFIASAVATGTFAAWFFAHSVGACVVTGIIGVLFKIEENTRPSG